jgi:uncharacterized protein (DUF302 family)
MTRERHTEDLLDAALENTFPASDPVAIAPAPAVHPDDGLVTIASNHGVKDTLDRLQAALAAKGIAVFARIDHAAGAAAAGMTLRPTELLIFGHPKAGTPLMQARQSIGLDLPLKVLGWQDEAGKVWLSYNNVAWLAGRHRLADTAAPAAAALGRTLASLAEAAAA